jgi:radical SAM protein with 4Fe4S-binding SPASM domain
MASRIIELFYDLHINSVIIIGGEPTLYNRLFDVVDYCNQKAISTTIVTNGLLFANEAFLRNALEHNIKNISVSFKGSNKQSFFSTTKVDGFETTLIAIKKCLNRGVNVGVSMVLTKENIPELLEGVRVLRLIGINNFHFSFCYNFNYLGDSISYQKPCDLLNLFYKVYDELDSILDHRFVLSNGIPLCLWEQPVLCKMIARKQISTTCQLLKRTGLLFSTDGSVIPCNAMYKLPFGKLGQDFSSAAELLEYFKTDSVQHLFARLCGLPSEECVNCEWVQYCGGGCVCNWTNYDFNEVKRWKEGKCTAITGE